jgi:hypothetical protein
MSRRKMLKKVKYALRFLPDKMYIKLYYFARFKRFCDLEHPKTFNEKLNWLKLHDRNPLYVRMVDKYEAKEYVSSIIGSQYIIPTLGVWEQFDDIEFDKLPNQFVLKCTHDSEGLVIVKDKSKLDKKAAKVKIENALKCNFYYIGREWPYKDVKPRIIAEQYMSNNGGDLDDYKVHNFDGVPKLILICSERFSESGLKEDFYDENWQRLDMCRISHPNSTHIKKKPDCLDEMLKLSQKLADGIPFLRTDFYEIDGKLYFGELTFYPASGFEPFSPDEWDYKMGQWITLNIKENSFS